MSTAHSRRMGVYSARIDYAHTPVVIGGGHSARHMGQSACATGIITLDFFS